MGYIFRRLVFCARYGKLNVFFSEDLPGDLKDLVVRVSKTLFRTSLMKTAFGRYGWRYVPVGYEPYDSASLEDQADYGEELLESADGELCALDPYMKQKPLIDRILYEFCYFRIPDDELEPILESGRHRDSCDPDVEWWRECLRLRKQWQEYQFSLFGS